MYHLVSNVCFLLLFGSIAAMFFHRASYLVLWFVAGIAGTAGQLIALSPRAYEYGASGVAFGLVGALWSASFVHRVASASAVCKWSIPFLLGILIILGFLPDWIHSHSFNTAHMAGLLAGMVLGLVLPTRATPAPARRFVAIVAITAVVFVACAKSAHAKQEPLLQLFAIEDAHPDLVQASARSLPEAAQLEQIVAHHPELVTAHLLLARAYFRQARYAEASREQPLVLAALPQQAALWNEAGRAFLNAHQYSQANAAFSRYIERISRYPTAAEQTTNRAGVLQALVSLAQSYESQGALDKAIEINRQILRADSQNLAAQDNLQRLLKLGAPGGSKAAAPSVTQPPESR